MEKNIPPKLYADYVLGPMKFFLHTSWQARLSLQPHTGKAYWPYKMATASSYHRQTTSLPVCHPVWVSDSSFLTAHQYKIGYLVPL